jgi:hypothetical protein
MTRRLIAAGLMIAATAAVPAVRLAAQNFNLPPGASMMAPDPNVPLFFEAASIKQNKEGGAGAGINRAPGGRFTTRNAALPMLITFAYQLQG